MVSVLALLAALLPTLTVVGASPAQAATTSDLLLRVTNARSVGTLVADQPIPATTTYQWLITAEDVGNPDDTFARCLPSGGDAAFPENCQWPSIRGTAGNVPIVTQGDSTELNATTGLTGADALPAGRYLISVLADGYKLGGGHFTIPHASPLETVALQPYPLPLGTVRVRVFHDNAPVDGTYEAGSETGSQGGQVNLNGFVAHLSDVLGEVTTDWFGNPLCTNYEHQTAGNPDSPVLFDLDGSPIVDAANPGGACVSDAAGDIVIPNLGSNRYGITLSKPAGKTDWAQTTTLEGAHDHDVWVMEGDTGFDTELVIGNEPVPAVQFGYVEPKALPAGPTAHVRGLVKQGLTYVGGTGGITLPGEPGTSGVKAGKPISRPWISLSDLGNGDQMVYTGRGATDGTFDIPNVPDGTYQLTYWDEPQDYIIFSFNVTVVNGQTVDVGTKYLAGWFTRIDGYVFVDDNGNGIKDTGEQGVPGTAVTLRERDNALMDQYTNTVTTNASGYYKIDEAYPLTKQLVLEHFNTRYAGTGVTVLAENDPAPTTFVGAAVDINISPVLGLGGRVDWGVKPYDPGTNGGIVGTVTYDTTRNELDPKDAAAETYQPGVPGIPVHLYGLLRDPVTGDPILDSRGLEQRGPELATVYTSETWEPGRGCTARQWDGTPLVGQQALAPYGLAANKRCVESPMMGWQARPSDTTPGAWGQTVNGNYGFADSALNLYLVGDPDNPGYPAGYAAAHPVECPLPTDCQPGNNDLPLYAVLADYGYDPQPLLADDYIVAVDLNDATVTDYRGKPLYQVTKEQDVNVFDGDLYLPQQNFPVSTNPATNPPGGTQPGAGEPPAPPTQSGGFVAPCVGADQTVAVTNPNFIDGGGSPFAGQHRPLCTDKLVTLRGQQAVAPTFYLFTPVPLPTHFWGIVINDLGLTWDKRSVNYGEAQGLPGVPVGLYDFGGRLVDTVKTDFNGFYEALEPSTSSFNCPTPAGPCAGMYRFVGNDPGQPGHANPNHNPRYRTIATNFQAYPGVYTVTDTAPTQVGVLALTPGSTTPQPVNCDVSSATPEVFAISDPVVLASASGTARRRTVTGRNFGTLTANSRIELVSALTGAPTNVTSGSTWSADGRSVSFTVPSTGLGFAPGPWQLRIRNGATGQWTTSAVTIHVLGALVYSPTIRHVGPGQPFATIQAALEASTTTSGLSNNLVVVHPGAQTAFNPRGAYLENVVLHSRIKLQGYGPGGIYPDGTEVRGSVIDGQAFDVDAASGAAWHTLVNGLTGISGPATVPDGASVTVLAGSTAATSFSTLVPGLQRAMIDGFRITGAFQQNVAGNINAVTGGVRTGVGAPGALVTQGGGIYVHAAADSLRVSNNVIVANGGSYGGGIRIGTPYAGDNNNDNVSIAYNTIRDNGGTNLAGGIGIFAGATGYTVERNDLCGNFSAEYGGGISHYGLSANGVIDHNRIWFNESYDEGGGVMIAGELPANPNSLSAGSGPLRVSANEIVVNTANDDGGGIRLLQVNNALVRIENNVIADNLSTHEGGGIALDDATNVQVVNNTVARNITTATAITSDGSAAPAGLSTAGNSVQLQASLPVGSPTYSNPVLLNNIFWENKAGSWNGVTVAGIGVSGDPTPQNFWDVGSTDSAAFVLQPRNGVMTQPNAGQTTPFGPTLPGTDVPSNATTAAAAPYVVKIADGTASRTLTFVSPYSVSVDIATLRAFPGFRQSVIVVRNLPPDLLGNYHLAPSALPHANNTAAFNTGVALRAYGGTVGNVTAPTVDFEGNTRYSLPATSTKRLDAGADELP